MLLNAANVVTAAERCKAIDEKTGRIPIHFLLSRSNDLDEHVKDQLQQLAAQSPDISINADRLMETDQPMPSPQVTDAVMTDVIPIAEDISPDESHQPIKPDLSECESDRDDLEHADADEDDDIDTDDEEYDEHEDDIESIRLLEGLPSIADESTQAEAEEALKDIDRETAKPERKTFRRNLKKDKKTLTRKAIRKHAGGKKQSLRDGLLQRDTGSTINTVSGSSCIQSSQGSAKSHTPRRRWKEWEDELLIRVVAEQGPTRWNTLAHHFPGRNGRQVRLRWMNHLQPSLDKRPWRPEEDAILLEAHHALGNKWALISMRLCGRTDNSVKNRYKSIVRRAAREAKARKQQQE